MDPNLSEIPPPGFPQRMFAIGEEPVGIRVTPYHKPSCISKILNALEEDEIRLIRGTAFGKLIEIAEKPSFSGRLGRFLISRQLKVLKRHEVWFLYAGKPVRFSIREFALVTGLNCRNYPPHSKKRSKKNISEKPYWGELFGTMKDVPVRYVVSMLKKKTVTDPQTRIKFALLALLSSVVLPTSHTPRISQEHAERIKDVDQFLSYPWGRVSFDMLMSSIKERNEVSLSQNTIAFKGFVMSMQLVLVEAVPALTGVVRDGGSSSSDADSGGDDDMCGDDKELKKSINTVHIRDIDTACKAKVNSIISAGVEQTNLDHEDVWSDDEEDVYVDNLVKSIEEGFPFTNSHFVGGATKSDVSRMREDAEKVNITRKTARSHQKQTATDPKNADYVANIVKNCVGPDLQKLDEQIKDLARVFTNSHNLLRNNIENILGNFHRDFAKLITTPCSRPHIPPSNQSPPEIPVSGRNPNVDSVTVDVSTIIQNAVHFANNGRTQRFSDCVGAGLSFPDPSFSIGLTQINKAGVDVDDHVSQPVNQDLDFTNFDNEAPIVNRKSKRAKVVPKNLVGEYQCDKRFLTRAWESYVNAICCTPNIDYSAKFSALSEKLTSPFVIDFGSLTLNNTEMAAIVDRSSHLSPKVLDVLVHHTRSVFLSNSELIRSKNSVFLDTKFVSLLAKSYAKFSKSSKKDSFRFPGALCEFVVGDSPISEANRFYFPFNFDKQHWVGVCVDTSLSHVIVLDCNISRKTDGMIAKDLRPISVMFPYLLRQVGKQLTAKDLKPLHIERPRCVPQNNTQVESGITSILLTQAHVVGGVDVCKCITPEVLNEEVQRIAVMIYEENVGVL
ncbi:hypothetical protein N665_4280s0003 [Sinapis alba]|nr:hypothetical protein N665_4280s0003 [Sinapis alba]